MVNPFFPALSAIVRDIDARVYALFGLDADEIALLESSLGPYRATRLC